MKLVGISGPETSMPLKSGAAQARFALWRIYRAAMRRYAPRDDGILARRLERTDDGWIVGEPCVLSTAEMLKAALLMEQHGITHPLDTRGLMDRLVARHVATADYEVVALTLWAAAIGDPRHAETLWDLLHLKLSRGASQSMPLAWTLCALCEYAAIARQRGDVRSLARGIFERILRNQDSRTGLFYASTRREGWLRRLSPDATLSSQSYPILALAAFNRAFGAPEALPRARRCADRLCTLQGPQGQWWRRYDARRGKVRDSYPVYCVNQDGAIPSALGSLQRQLGEPVYESAITRGLLWESGANEIGRSLIDEQSGFVAQSIARTEDGHQVSWEMYAYQPARCLYALLSNPEWAREVA